MGSDCGGGLGQFLWFRFGQAEQNWGQTDRQTDTTVYRATPQIKTLSWAPHLLG